MKLSGTNVGSIYLSSSEVQRESRVVSVITFTSDVKNIDVYMTEPQRSITSVVIYRISRARIFYEEVDVTCGSRMRDSDGLDGEFRVRVSFVDE